MDCATVTLRKNHYYYYYYYYDYYYHSYYYYCYYSAHRASGFRGLDSHWPKPEISKSSKPNRNRCAQNPEILSPASLNTWTSTFKHPKPLAPQPLRLMSSRPLNRNPRALTKPEVLQKACSCGVAAPRRTRRHGLGV